MRTKRLNRFLAAALSIVMVLSLFVVPASAVEGDLTGAVGDTWSFTSDTDFTADDYAYSKGTELNFKGLTISAGAGYHNGYCYMNNGHTVTVPVAGKCNVVVTTQHGAAGTVGDVELETDKSNLAPTVYSYDSEEAGTVTISATATTYLCSVEIKAFELIPSLKLDKSEVTLKMGDTETATVTATLKNSTDTITATSDAESVATAAVESDGETVTITAVAEGTATVTVSAGDLEQEVAVTVQAAGKVDIAPGVYRFAKWHQGNSSTEVGMNVAGLTWTVPEGGNAFAPASGHGPHTTSGGSLTVSLPEDKYATVTLTTCAYGAGGTVNKEEKTATLQINGEDVVGTKPDGDGEDDFEFTFKNVQGPLVIPFTGEVYVHGITVSEFTDDPVVDPVLTVSKEVVVKVGGQAATVTPTVENVDSPVVTATSDDESVATVSVGADNAITVTPVAAGVATVTVAVTGTDLTGSITVYVQPATIGEVKEGTYDFTGEDGKATYLTTADIAISSGWKYHGDEHGLTNNAADTIEVTIPADKKANVTLITCRFGGAGITSTTGDLSKDSVQEGTDNDGNPVMANTWTLVGATGTANFTAPTSGSVYIHGLKVELLDLDAATLAVSTNSVTMREKESKEITATAEGYDASMSLFAISADTTKATVALDGDKITVTGVAAGETTVYVGMAATAPADATAAAAVEGVKTVAVTVTPGLAEGTKEWVWGGKDGSHSAETCEKDSEGLKFPENNKKVTTEEDGTEKTTYVVWYHNHYGLLLLPRKSSDGNSIEVPATIGIPVDGPSTITVEVGYTWDIMLGDAQDPSRYGTSDNGSSTSEYQYPVVFDYYGGAGYVTLTATDKTSTYIYSIKVEPKTGATANPKVAVWDFMGTQLDETMFDNKLTVDDIIAFYQPSEQWPDSKVPTLGSFATKDGELEFVAEASTQETLSYNGVRNDYRLRTGSAALENWVHSTNNYTKNDVAKGQDPYDANLTSYGVSFQSNGGVMTFKIKASAGDKLTFTYANSGTADGAVFMDFIDAADAASGTVTKVLENHKGKGNGNVDSVYVSQTGVQTLTHGPMPSDATQAQKPAVARFYRETPTKVTISGNLTVGEGVTDGYKLIATDDVSGVEYEATIADGTYSIEVNNYLSGTSFTLSVADAEGCIVGAGEQVELAPGATSADNDVTIIKVELVEISGTVTGLGDALANLVIAVGIPADKIYVPKIVPAADGTYTAKLEKDVAYTLTAKNVNDYALDTTALNKGADETDVTIAFTKKPVYAVTLTADPADVDMSAMKFTFTNINETDDKHPDGYAYTFEGTTGIELRDGQYKVKLDGAPYPTKLVSDLKVEGAAASKTITFVKETPTSWVFTKETFTADVVAAKDFNLLKLDGDVRREDKDHAIMGNGGKLSIPVDGPCRVDVTVYYRADGTVGVGDDTVPMTLVEGEPAYGSTSATKTVSYDYAGPGAGYVDVNTNSTTYVTRIDVVEVSPYKPTLTVGVDKDFQTVQAAVDAATEMERPNNERVTIVIDPGNYEEMVWVRTPNLTFKNAAANPSLALKNQGKDIEDTGVRITWYYGCGFDYYSMGPNSKFSAEQLAVNKENGYVSHPNSAGGGSNNECWWNATTVIAATGFEAEGIIFENSFNQYVSAAAANDVIVPNGGAKEDSQKPRASLPEGSTEVQRKPYVERAAAIALANNVASNAVFTNCAFVGHQDVIYGGSNVKAAFYDCDVFGACDYIFGPMTAVFAKCDLVLNVGADSDSNDAAYITAPQNGSNVHGYLMYNCNVRSVEPGVENAGSALTALQHEFGRAWSGASAECIFYETTVGTNANGKSLISPAGWNTGLGSSQICAEYHTHEEAADADHTQRIMGGVLETPETKAGVSIKDYVGWLGGWNPFEGKNMAVVCPDADPVTGITLTVGDEAAEASYELTVGKTMEFTVTVAPDTADQDFLVTGGNAAVTVTKGEGKITVTAVFATTDPVEITVTAVAANADGESESATVSFTVKAASRPQGGGTGGVSSGSNVTITTVTNPDGSVATIKKYTNGNVEISVVSPEGETLAELNLPASVSAPSTKFVDVPAGHWAEKCINDMAALGLVKGVNEDGTIFDMTSPITRGSVATILYRLANGKAGKTSAFADVPADSWYADAIGWAANAKLINGYDEVNFGPDDTITRQQLAVLIARMARLAGTDTSASASALEAFTDGADTADWATAGMAWCVKAGIVKGRGGDVLDPTAAVTRAEAVTMIDRMLSLLK